MSKQAAVAFLEQVAGDPKSQQETIDRAVHEGAKLGFVFSGQELQEALEKKWGNPTPAKDLEAFYCCICLCEVSS
jgi:hypothetical protein